MSSRSFVLKGCHRGFIAEAFLSKGAVISGAALHGESTRRTRHRRVALRETNLLLRRAIPATLINPA